MDALMEGRTVFVIAHRLSTVKNANVIIVWITDVSLNGALTRNW